MSARVDTTQSSLDISTEPKTGSWRLRCARRLQRMAAGFAQLPKPLAMFLAPSAKLLSEGIALGLMLPEDVNTFVADTYRSAPEFYDPRRYRLNHEERLVPVLQGVTNRTRLLDAFCGQGREAKIFANAGFDVTGVDQFSWMIDAAKNYSAEAGFPAEFIVSDFRTFAADSLFDIVYTSCWMYSTCQGREQRRELLQQCLRQTTDDGLIVISTVDASVGSRAVATIRFALARLTSIITRGNSRTEFGERIYQGLFWHHLSEATVRDEIESCGLVIVDSVSGNDIEPRFYILAQASSACAETSS